MIKTVKARLILLFILLSAVATFMVGGYFIYSIIQQNTAANEAYRSLLVTQFDREIKMQTQGLVSSLNGIYDAQKAGKISEADAKSMAIAVIKSTRYDDGKGYFFADDKKPASVWRMLPWARKLKARNVLMTRIVRVSPI